MIYSSLALTPTSRLHGLMFKARAPRHSRDRQREAGASKAYPVPTFALGRIVDKRLKSVNGRPRHPRTTASSCYSQTSVMVENGLAGARLGPRSFYRIGIGRVPQAVPHEIEGQYSHEDKGRRYHQPRGICNGV